MNEKLEKSLISGFIDRRLPSHDAFLPQLLVNDRKEGKKVLSSIIRSLYDCDEFWFSVAFITTDGVATLIETLIALEQKGIKGKILVSQYLNFTQPEALRRLLQFRNLEVKIAVNHSFHSKGYLFRKKDVYDLIIGSSNLTATALCSNVEWNLKVTATPLSYVIFNAIREFTREYERAVPVNDEFIRHYEALYRKQVDYSRLLKKELFISGQTNIVPNAMQVEALANIENLRNQGKDKALLISATGTGKTYLSAFDVKKVDPRRFLFVVHRLNIAQTSMQAYRNIFGESKKMGIYSGNRLDSEADFVFSTVQTLSRDEHLTRFSRDHFDYIVVDETHRAGANSYQKILDHFRPSFLLGMTATPERTDGLDVFRVFDYNIAYEIRLHKALEEEMLSPFHYYGIADISVDGVLLEDEANFNLLSSNERIDRIIEKSKVYGSDNGKVKGLIFCSKIEECAHLSDGFNKRGFKTVVIAGGVNDEVRTSSIAQLERGELDYIFSCDVLNEGIDIPSVNQIIMLRPTQSVIVFVQQLGRGLRKTDDKEYLTVIDFIGNYKNNFLLPVALYGDTSYNKDKLRKLISGGSNMIPGTSTVNFDRISREKIYEAIDTAQMQLKKDLVNEYKLMKFRLGRIPMMTDFIQYGARDPQLFVSCSKSYFNFVADMEEAVKPKLNSREKKILELFATEINNTKRVEECIILKMLIIYERIEISDLKLRIETQFSFDLSEETLDSCINNLNFRFATERKNSKLLTLNEIYGVNMIKTEGSCVIADKEFSDMLLNSEFFKFLADNIDYSISVFESLFDRDKYVDGFVLYRKYSRKDVFRILNWEKNPLAQNVGGYILSRDNSNCAIFVNYHKEENISHTTRYKDQFLSHSEFEWMSKSNRTLDSPDVKAIKNYESGLRLPFFVKKSNDEGTEFYYMGDVTPVEDSFEQTSLADDHGKPVPVVRVVFRLNYSVEETLYDYLTSKPEQAVSIPVGSALIDPEEKYPFRVLPTEKAVPYKNCIPLYDIKVAAGDFSQLQVNEDTSWIELGRPFNYSDEYFVCQVVGESMNKVIPNNSWCLFRRDTGGSRNGKIVLVHQMDIQDADFGAGFTVKEYESIKSTDENGWKHNIIVLKPRSYIADYQDLILTDDALTDFRVLGVFVEVL
jgi:superfamily II DNA or RNA helicase